MQHTRPRAIIRPLIDHRTRRRYPVTSSLGICLLSKNDGVEAATQKDNKTTGFLRLPLYGIAKNNKLTEVHFSITGFRMI